MTAPSEEDRVVHELLVTADGDETDEPAADGDEAADTAVPDGVVHAQMPDLGTPLNPDVTRARELCERLGGVNVYLVGMMGAGKSSVGDVLAQRFGRYSLVDTDSLIEQLTSASIAEIFESEGERASGARRADPRRS